MTEIVSRTSYWEWKHKQHTSQCSSELFCLAFARHVDEQLPWVKDELDLYAPDPLGTYASLQDKLSSGELDRGMVLTKFACYADGRFPLVEIMAGVFGGGYYGIYDPFQRLFSQEFQDRVLFYFRRPDILHDDEITVTGVDLSY